LVLAADDGKIRNPPVVEGFSGVGRANVPIASSPF
jgi:hypothetical protein